MAMTPLSADDGTLAHGAQGLLLEPRVNARWVKVVEAWHQAHLLLQLELDEAD
jgi:hypothetical protein